MRHTRRYVLLAFSAVGLTVLAALALNTAVNPLRVTPAPWTVAALDPYREIDSRIRTSKAGLIRSGRWRVAIFGSSRPALALDPSLPDWRRDDVVNLSLQAATLPETLAVFRYAASRQPLEIALVGIDAGDLTTPPIANIATDFAGSPFDPQAVAVERELRYLLGLSTLEESIATLGRAWAGQPAAHDPHGFRRKADNPVGVRRVTADFYVPFAARQAAARRAGAGPDPAELRVLSELISEARCRNIRLFLFLMPTHFSYFAALRSHGDPLPSFADERAAILGLVEQANRIPGAQAVEFWDFNTRHPANLEPLPAGDQSSVAMRWWLDPLHAKPALGRIMLGRMLGWPLDDPAAADYGTPVDRAAADWLAREIDRGIDEYLAANPADAALLGPPDGP